MLHNLRDAVSRRIANGGVFSDFSQESIDRFFLYAGEKHVFCNCYPEVFYAQTPEIFAQQAWRALFYDQKILRLFSEDELARYIDRLIADFEPAEDLNLKGILGIGLLL